MGVALGCIGMSLHDFEQCTPSEFRAVFDRWKTDRESMVRMGWEQIRMQCLCSLQPYSRKHLRAKDVMEFPWDNEKTEKTAEDMTVLKERYKAAMKKYNLH